MLGENEGRCLGGVGGGGVMVHNQFFAVRLTECWAGGWGQALGPGVGLGVGLGVRAGR